MTYFDYRFRFRVSRISQALAILTAFRRSGFLGTGNLPDNMLGDPLDASGARVVPAEVSMEAAATTVSNVAFYGRRGAAGRGDPSYIYLHARSMVDPATLTFDPMGYGLEPVSAADSAVVLGVWA